MICSYAKSIMSFILDSSASVGAMLLTGTVLKKVWFEAVAKGQCQHVPDYEAASAANHRDRGCWREGELTVQELVLPRILPVASEAMNLS